MTRVFTAAAVALMMVTVAAQSAMTGTWAGATPNGLQIVLDLAVTDTAVTGTLSRDGQPAPIADGKVSKNAVTFKVTFGDQTESFSGELAGDQLTVWLDRQGPAGAVVFTRVRN